MGEALSGGEPGSPECVAGEYSEVKNTSQLSGLPPKFYSPNSFSRFTPLFSKNAYHICSASSLSTVLFVSLYFLLLDKRILFMKLY